MTDGEAGLEIRPLDPTTFDALTGLFAHGDPRDCWCMYWRLPGGAWSLNGAAQNREGLRSLAGGTRPPGLVAFRGREAVGWVSLAARPEYVRLERSRTIPRIGDDGVWSIVCFVVAAGSRRTGVAEALLAAAVDHARSSGARIVEAYPVRTEGRRMPSSAVYTGTLGMFERAGFEVVAETGSRAQGRARVVVRRQL